MVPMSVFLKLLRPRPDAHGPFVQYCLVCKTGTVRDVSGGCREHAKVPQAASEQSVPTKRARSRRRR